MSAAQQCTLPALWRRHRRRARVPGWGSTRFVEATQGGNDDADVDEDVLPETGAWTLLVAGMGLLALLLGGITLRRFRLPGARDMA